MAPYCLRVCRGSKGKARGVWAVHSIESWAWFGPLEGEISPAKKSGSTPPPQTWEIFCGEQACHLLGVNNNGTNWLNHVTSTYVTWSAVNMAAYQYRGQIYYVTTKVIGQGQELVLGLDFSNHYQTLVNWRELKQSSKDFVNKKTCIVCRRHYDDTPLAARRSDWRSQALNVQVEIDDFLPTLKLSPSEVYDRLHAPNKQVQENSRRQLSRRIFCCHKCGWKFGTFVRYALHKRNHHLRHQRCQQTKTREDGLKSGGYVHEIAVESEVQGTTDAVMEHSGESKLNGDVAVEMEKNKKAEESGDSLEENTSRRHEYTQTQGNKESGDTGRLRPLEDGRPLVQNSPTECLEECTGSGDAGRLIPLEDGKTNTTETDDKSVVRKTKETRVENGRWAGRNLRQRKLPPKCRERNKCKQTTSDAKRPDVSKLTPSLVVNGAKKLDRFPCTLCTKSFTSNSNLGKHVRIHTGEKPHECDHCGKRFSEASNLKTHLRVHTGHNPYECQTCHKRFKYLKGFKMHLAQHERTPVTHKCGVCDREFNQRGPCTTHEKSHQSEKPFRCTVCKMKFKREGGLRMHLEKMHPRPTPSCKNGVARKKRGKAKGTNVDVKPRQGSQEARAHRCQDCGKEFKFNYSLKQHRRIHTGEKPFKCTQCGAAFSQSANLTSHRRIHTGEKPYECRQCDKRFACAQNLRSHLRVHTGERPYQCPQCSARFAYSSYLKTHSLVHSDRKPLKCEECGKEYRHPASFKSHCRTHAKN